MLSTLRTHSLLRTFIFILYCLTGVPKATKKQRLVIESDGDDADNAEFNTPVKLAKKDEQLAPCCSIQC